MRVLLDTSALFVASGLTDLHFSSRVQNLLAEPETERLLSAASLMEVAIKTNRGLTALNRGHVAQAVTDLQLTLIPFLPTHAYKLFALPPHHRDPFDRMLIATALVEDVPIVSNDRSFKAYRGLHVIW